MTTYAQNAFAGETRAMLWHMNAIVTAGAAIAIFNNASMAFNHYAQQNPAVLNDRWYHLAYLKAGTWTVDMLARKNTGSGILTLKIINAETTEQTYSNTFDLYAADTFNVKLQDAAVNVNRDGLYQIQGSMDTKNGASAGYVCFLTMMSLYRTLA